MMTAKAAVVLPQTVMTIVIEISLVVSLVVPAYSSLLSVICCTLVFSSLPVLTANINHKTYNRVLIRSLFVV